MNYSVHSSSGSSSGGGGGGGGGSSSSSSKLGDSDYQKACDLLPI